MQALRVLGLVGIIAWLAYAAPATAAPPPQPPPMRLAVVLFGPARLIEEVQEELTLPLSGVAQIVQTSEYRRAAAAIGIRRHPRSNRAAPFVGRALGASYVLLIDGVRDYAAGGQMFMGVRLVHAGSSQVLMAKRYFLPEGHLTPSIAEAIRLRLITLVAPPAGGLPLPVPTPVPAPPIRRQLGADGTQVPRRPDPQARASSSRHVAPAAEVRAQAQSLPAHRSWIAVVPRLVWRTAQLRPQMPLGPNIPYSAGGGLGRSMTGAQVAWGIYGRRLGFEGDVGGSTGVTAQAIDGSIDDGKSRYLSARAAVAVNLITHPSARLAPRAGFTFDMLPINLGPFIGVSYAAATLGLRAASPKWRTLWQLEGTIDYLFLGKLGLEATRAGEPGLAQGVLLSLTPVVWLQRWRIALGLGLDYRWARFRGATALFAPVHYRAMQLRDTRLQVGLNVGFAL